MESRWSGQRAPDASARRDFPRAVPGRSRWSMVGGHACPHQRMVKSARAAMMALHLSGVVFGGPFADPASAAPQARDVHALKVECGSNRALGLEWRFIMIEP